MTLNFRGFLLALACAAVLVLASGIASAGEFTTSWTAPTTRADGTPLAAGELAEYRVEWGLCASGGLFPPAPAGNLSVPSSQTTATVTGIPAGTWCIRVFASDTGGRTSDSSNVASKLIELAPPSAPTTVTVR